MPEEASGRQPTEIIILGTIHDNHNRNPNYAGEDVKRILVALKPAAILVEADLTMVKDDGSVEESEDCPETAAGNAAARELGVRQIPFDRPDRNAYYATTRYFDRLRAANDALAKWLEELRKQQPDATVVKLSAAAEALSQSQVHLTTHVGPEIINSDGFDYLMRAKRGLERVAADMLPLFQDRPGYQTVVEDSRFLSGEWTERNQIMADNVMKAAAQSPGQRLVAITGCEHRSIIRDLLAGKPALALKEFWELLPLR